MSGRGYIPDVKASDGFFQSFSVSKLPGFQDRGHSTPGCPQESYEHAQQSADNEAHITVKACTSIVI